VAATVKSLRESLREWDHAWADLLRTFAQMLNEAAARADGRAYRDQLRQFLEGRKNGDDPNS
jgi:hypothetical protein